MEVFPQYHMKNRFKNHVQCSYNAITVVGTTTHTFNKDARALL